MDTDPNIVERLKKQPPYDDETNQEPEEPVEEVIDEPKEAVDQPEEPVEAPVEDVKVDEEPEEDKSKKRTQEQFEKLKEHNNNLKQENENLKKNVLDSLIPDPQPPRYPESPITNVVPPKEQYPGLTQQQIRSTFEGLVDDQGYVDTGLLITTLKEQRDALARAEERAKVAEQRAAKTEKTVDDFERNALMRRVHKKYPKLDPESKNFDERLWQGVRNEVIGQWTSGQQENVMEAAEKWSKILYGEEKVVNKKEKELEDSKRNINALGAKQASPRATKEELDVLIEGTRRGKPGSLAERLKRSGY
jgi:hypothetical protein